MAGEVQGTYLSAEQLLQFRITNTTQDVIPNIPFMTNSDSFNATTQYQWLLPANLNVNITTTPTITILQIAPLVVQVPVNVETLPGLSYNQVQQSISTNNYEANFIYAYSPNCNQVNQVFTYNQSDIAGNQTVTALPFSIDPYQTQCSVYYYPAEGSVLFDGTSQLNFTMLPESSMGIKIFSSTASSTMILDEISGFQNNTFAQVEKAMGTDIFADYCNYLIDHE